MSVQRSRLIVCPDGRIRCHWAGNGALMRHYHDHEWGKPVSDDAVLFEKISLEGFQAGLSWRTILEKRENFREAFDGFDMAIIARYKETEVARLVRNPLIIRHEAKIRSVINNAGRALELQRTFGSLAAYFWSFAPKSHEQPVEEPQKTSEEARRMAVDLKVRGWKFVGPVICYSFMQAMGLVNDHIKGCDFCPAPPAYY